MLESYITNTFLPTGLLLCKYCMAIHGIWQIIPHIPCMAMQYSLYHNESPIWQGERYVLNQFVNIE